MLFAFEPKTSSAADRDDYHSPAYITVKAPLSVHPRQEKKRVRNLSWPLKEMIFVRWSINKILSRRPFCALTRLTSFKRAPTEKDKIVLPLNCFFAKEKKSYQWELLNHGVF